MTVLDELVVLIRESKAGDLEGWEFEWLDNDLGTNCIEFALLKHGNAWPIVS